MKQVFEKLTWWATKSYVDENDDTVYFAKIFYVGKTYCGNKEEIDFFDVESDKFKYERFKLQQAIFISVDLDEYYARGCGYRIINFYKSLFYEQETHGKEYDAWIEETSRFYNEGFFEAWKKIGSEYLERTCEAVADRLNRQLLGKFKWSYTEGSISVSYGQVCCHNYCHYEGSGRVYKIREKYVMRGDSTTDVGGWDGLMGCDIDWQFDSMQELLSCIEKHRGEYTAIK